MRRDGGTFSPPQPPRPPPNHRPQKPTSAILVRFGGNVVESFMSKLYGWGYPPNHPNNFRPLHPPQTTLPPPFRRRTQCFSDFYGNLKEKSSVEKGRNIKCTRRHYRLTRITTAIFYIISRAESLGYRTLCVTTDLDGIARDRGVDLANMALYACR